MKDFLYYVRLPWYQRLLQEAWDAESENIPEKNKLFFQELMNASNPLDLVKIGVELPILETNGKLFAIEGKLRELGSQGKIPSDSKIAGIVIGGAREFSNKNDKLIGNIAKQVRVDGIQVSQLNSDESDKVEIYKNTGFPFEISSSILRGGVDNILANNEFDPNTLRAVHWPVLAMANDSYQGPLRDGTGKIVYHEEGKAVLIPIHIGGPKSFGDWMRTSSVGKSVERMHVYPNKNRDPIAATQEVSWNLYV